MHRIQTKSNINRFVPERSANSDIDNWIVFVSASYLSMRGALGCDEVLPMQRARSMLDHTLSFITLEIRRYAMHAYAYQPGTVDDKTFSKSHADCKRTSRLVSPQPVACHLVAPSIRAIVSRPHGPVARTSIGHSCCFAQPVHFGSMVGDF